MIENEEMGWQQRRMLICVMMLTNLVLHPQGESPMLCVGTCGQLHPVVMLNDSFPVRLMCPMRLDAHGANPHFS